VDSKAKFIFVPVDRIEDIVKKENAIPYDAPSVELGHHGEKCSFDAIIEKYDIKDDALIELAKIVRAADTDKPEISNEGAGLSAIMTGLSAAAKNDLEAIEEASPVYDALYNYCKVKLITERYKQGIEKMDRPQKRRFLKEKLKES
jgi:hypothetical protein